MLWIKIQTRNNKLKQVKNQWINWQFVPNLLTSDTLWQLLVIPSPFTSLILLRSAISCAYILCRSKRYSKFSLLVIELCIYTIAVKSCTASHCGQSILFPETFFLDLFMWLDECQWRWHEQKHHILWFGLSPYNLPWEAYALGSH